MNPDNAARKSAEELIEKQVASNPEQFAIGLLQLIETTQSKAAVELGLLTLYKTVLCKDDNYRKIANPTLIQIQNTLFQMIAQTATGDDLSGVQKRLAEITVQISVKENTSANHFTFLINTWNGSCTSKKLIVLYSLELLFEHIKSEQPIETHNEALAAILASELKAADSKVRIACATMFAMMVSCIETDTLLSKFKTHFEVMLQLIIQIVQEQNEDRSVALLSSVEDFVTFHPKFIEQYLDTLLWIIDEISKTSAVAENVRNAAVNLLTTVVDQLPVACKKSKFFEKTTMPTVFRLLVENATQELESELDLSSKDTLTGTVTKQTMSAVAVEALSKMGSSLGNKYTLVGYMPMIVEGLRSTAWQAQNAALLTLGLLVEGAKEKFAQDFDQLVSLVLPFLTSQTPKVVFNALTCLAFVATEFTPKLQTNYSAQILPVLLQLISQEQHVELSIRAISCLVNYFRELMTLEESEALVNAHLQPYLGPLAEALLIELERGARLNNLKMIEETLCLTSVVSSLMQTNFISQYDRFMTIIKQLLQSLSGANLSHQQKSLKALLLDTLGFILAACSGSPELLNRDLPSILTFLDAQLVDITDDSPVAKSVIGFYTVFVENLRDKFEPLFPKAFELALKFSQIVVEVHFEDADQATEKKEHFESMEINLPIYGGKKVFSINHVALELKIASMALLASLIKRFGPKLSHDQVVSLLQFNAKYITEVHSYAIKVLVFKMLAKLIKLLPISERWQTFESLSPLMITYVGSFVAKGNIEQLSYFLRKYLSVLKGLTESRARFYDPVPGVVPNAIVGLGETLKQALAFANKKKLKVFKEFKDADLKDEDVREQFESKVDDMTLVEQAVMEISGELIKLEDNQGLYRQLLTGLLLPHYTDSLNRKTHNSTNETLYSLCFFADLYEFGPEDFFTQTCSQVIIAAIGKIENNQEQVDVLQTLAYLLGTAGYRLPAEGQAQLAQTLMATLYQFLQAPIMSGEESKECRDNVVSALVRLFLKHGKTLAPGAEQSLKVMNVLSENLPLLADKEESKTLNHILVVELANGNQLLTGAPECLKLTQDILARVKAADAGKTDRAEKVTDEFTEASLQKLA